MTDEILQLARACGFHRAGVAVADPLDDSIAAVYDRWLAGGAAADMSYLQDNRDKRFAPAALLSTVRSVICLAMSYAPSHESQPSCASQIAPYARGRDYHKVLKKRAHQLCDLMRQRWPELEARAFADTAPIAERSWATRAGLGWLGRNGMLIVPGAGSRVVLAEIFCNLPLAPTTAESASDSCGACRRCVDACPTQAIGADGLIDARRCLSYHTIENREHWPEELWPVGGSLFGCDVCQAVCPKNRDLSSGEPELCPSDWQEPSLAEVLHWGEADWDTFTRGKAMRRAKWPQFIRNAILAAGCSGDVSLLAPLEVIRANWPQWQREISWAIGRLGQLEA